MILAVAACIIPQIQTNNPKKNRTIRLSIAGAAIVISAVIIIVHLIPIPANGQHLVYITSTGTKYHDMSCQHLHSSCIETTLASAIGQGYSACSQCQTPVYFPTDYQRTLLDLFNRQSLLTIVYIILAIGILCLLHYLLYLVYKGYHKRRKPPQ